MTSVGKGEERAICQNKHGWRGLRRQGHRAAGSRACWSGF